MAQRDELISTLCLVWNTERPYKDTPPHKSSDFCLMGAKYHLELEYSYPFGLYDHYYMISVIQDPKTRSPKKQYHVTTFVEDWGMVDGDHRRVTPCGDVALVESTTKTRIWCCSEDEVLRNFRRGHSVWRVTCLFHCVASSVSLCKNDTIHLSSRTDADSLTTDKCARPLIETHLERLSRDYSNLLENKIFPDVNLSCAGQIWSVHRSILAARSEVFSAMFRNKMVESETGSVDVKDLDASVLDMLLKYVYSGKVPDLCDDVAASLYEAGDKYAMITLKTACSDWMIRNMTEENCVIFLNIADAHSDDEFKKEVLAFINDHPTIFKSDVWSVFSEGKIKLAKEVLQGYVASILE